MFHKVKDVTPLSDYKLFVAFENGESKTYNVKQLFDKWEVFKSLSQVSGLFDQVKVEQGGYAVSWNDYLDISCHELYNNSTPNNSLTKKI